MSTQLLNKTQIENRINRIAFQIYEDNFEETEIIIAGIADGGFVFAQRIANQLEKIGKLKFTLIEIEINKNEQSSTDIQLPFTKEHLKNKTVIVVDDVLNSGKTLMYSLIPFLNADVKKIRTVLLIDRDHKRYPVNADFVGFELSTTMKEHVHVDLTEGNEQVTLS
jgi:pyrimidine operon attenuation protein/uracil phosphoribosyltransferase